MTNATQRAILPIATYVMVTEPLGDRLAECLHTRSAIYDSRFAFDYYRPLPDTRLLWGGRISIRDRSPRAVQRLLTQDLLRVFPQLKGVRIDYAWSGLIIWKLAGLFVAGGVAGGLLGGRLAGALALRRGALNATFASVIIAVAIYMLVRSLASL